MGFKVRIRQCEDAIDVQMGETILQAALRNGISYPSGCQSGNCAACKSHLHDGEIEMSPYSEYALTDTEQAAGMILACRAVPWSDAEVSWLAEDDVVTNPVRHITCTVTGLDDLTHDIKRVSLTPSDGEVPEFTPGQYAKLTFDDLPGRDYSMAGHSDDTSLEFHIRAVPDGAVSSHVADMLAIGDAVQVEMPMGIAHVRTLHTGPVALIAGGSGIAPIMSILRSVLTQPDMGTRPVHLFIGVRAERDIYLEDHFVDLAAKHDNLTITWALSEPGEQTERRKGHLAAIVQQDLLRHLPLDGWKAYLAGPPVMVDTCTDVLEDLGIGRENCHADAFFTASEMAENQA